MILPSVRRLPNGSVASYLEMLAAGLGTREAAAERAPATFAEFLPPTGPSSYVWDWPHQQHLYRYLQAVTDGVVRKLIINMPPRHTKTETVTIRYPLYRLTQDPSLQVVIGCYNQTQAKKYSRKARGIARQLGLPLSQEQQKADEWETLMGGGVMARGVGAGVTGNGYHLILIDDPVKSREEAESPAYRDRCWDWFTDDLYTRLEPGGAILLNMTRWHEDDLVGRILASEDGPNWTVVNLPALAEAGDPLGRPEGDALCPDRFPVSVLLDRKRVLGSAAFNALYQGRPAPPEGAVLQRAWWHRYTVAPAPMDCMLASWDCTFKGHSTSDYVVGQVWGAKGADMYLLDQVRGHLGFQATLAAIRDQVAKWPMLQAILVEDKANGSAIIETLQHQIPGVIPVNPAGGKLSRVQAVSPLIEAGNVFVPAQAPWVGDFLEECATFPYGPHDDQVDAMSQALFRLSALASAYDFMWAD